jgi:5-methylcytosine-specific restriction endonuclease McrA
MLREDSKASFQARPLFLFWTRYQFGAGRNVIGATLSKRDYRRIDAEQQRSPVLVCTRDRRRWWAFRGRFYWEDEELHSDDVAALVHARQHRKQRQLDRAKDLMSLDADPSRRERIPEDVQRLVFRRDGGRCVKCGSRELLQFDHVIPVALGGSSTAENLQVLCTNCNREKSDSL